MSLKRIFVVLMVFVMAIATFSGCSDSEKNTQSNEAKNTEIYVDDLKIEVLSCSFDKEVMGIDEELSGYGFTERNGKVYVNLALKITNNGTTALKKDDIKGYFEYDELRYDLQYELMLSVPVRNDDDSLSPECIGFVNMISLVDEAATSEDLTVHFTIKENEYSEKVMPIDTRSHLEKKTEVSAGDSFNVNGLYEVNVIECVETKYLRATNYNESEQYQYYNKKFIDLVLSVKNNTNVNLSAINGYVIIDEEGVRANERVENSENTDLEYLSIEPIKSGEEGIVHIFVTVDEDINTDGLAMRFNLGGNCYYCNVK